MNSLPNNTLPSNRNNYRKEDTKIVCNITGITATIVVPFFPNFSNLCYDGLHPLANLDTATRLARMKYSEGHATLSPELLAGAILFFLHELDILERGRINKTEAVKINRLIQELPSFTLSKILKFLSELNSYSLKRIPAISFSEMDSTTLVKWYNDAMEALDTAIAEREYYVAPVVKKSIKKESSKIVELKQEGQILLKRLVEDGILPFKLRTIITISLKKDSLVTLGKELRKNICDALETLGTDDCLELAKVFKDAETSLTGVERIKASLFDSDMEAASDSFDNTLYRKPTLKEILDKKLGRKVEEEQAEQAEEEESAEGEMHASMTSTMLSTIQEDQEAEEEEEEDQDEDNEEEEEEEDLDGILAFPSLPSEYITNNEGDINND